MAGLVIPIDLSWLAKSRDIRVVARIPWRVPAEGSFGPSRLEWARVTGLHVTVLRLRPLGGELERSAEDLPLLRQWLVPASSYTFAAKRALQRECAAVLGNAFTLASRQHEVPNIAAPAPAASSHVGSRRLGCRRRAERLTRTRRRVYSGSISRNGVPYKRTQLVAIGGAAIDCGAVSTNSRSADVAGGIDPCANLWRVIGSAKEIVAGNRSKRGGHDHVERIFACRCCARDCRCCRRAPGPG